MVVEASFHQSMDHSFDLISPFRRPKAIRHGHGGKYSQAASDSDPQPWSHVRYHLLHPSRLTVRPRIPEEKGRPHHFSRRLLLLALITSQDCKTRKTKGKSTLQMSLLVPTPPQTLSFSRTVASPNAQLFLLRTELSHLSLRHTPRTMPIRMGGGPRTYPGGVSKWQWKRMQKNKAKQLLKARLCRERQIYEMRKRAELQAAVSELERPWEAVEKAPRLLSVTADDQLKALADRFQRPGGFDMWTDRDGPQVFGGAEAELPSARFFPKGVVHSVKPYGRIGDGKDDELDGSSGASGGGAMAPWNGGYRGRKSRRVRQRGTIGTETYSGSDYSDGETMNFQGSVESSGMVAVKNEKEFGVGLRKIGDRRRDHGGSNVKDHRRVGINQKESSGMVAVKNEKEIGVGLRKGGDRRRDHGGSNVRDHRRVGINQKKRGESYSGRARGSRIGEIIQGLKKPRDSVSEVYDMSLQQDGSFGL